MARYRITTPDGKRTFEVDGPDDATEQELQDFARQQAGVGDNYPVQHKIADPETELVSDIGAGASELVNGALEGGANVLDHSADWTQSGLNAAGQAIAGSNWGDNLNSLWGSGQNDLTGAVPQARDGLGTIRGIGRFGGETAATAPLALLRGGALVQGGATGALLSDEKTPLGILKDAGMGAVGARASEIGLNAASSALRPNLDPRVRTLLNEGVELTTGQMAGQGRPIKRIEDIAATVPLVSTPVADAQRNATVSLNRAATNRALRPIGETVPQNIEIGHDSVAFAGDRLRQAYADVLPRLSGANDQTFATRVNTLAQRAQLPAEYQRYADQARTELSNAFQGAGPNGAYNGRTLRDTSERLEDLASGWRRSDDPYIRRAGDLAEDYRQQLHALARRQNPKDAGRLRDIDRGYASLVRVERAARGTDDGVFTARQYDAAVRNSDRSARRRQSARGQALDQELSSAAAGVMPNTAGQGGSKDVNSLIGLAALTSGVLGLQPAALGAGAGIIAGRQFYRPGSQEALRDFLSRNPGQLRSDVGRLLQYGARAAPVATPALIDQYGR